MRLKRNIPISNLTTFKTGGTARYYAEVDTKKELLGAIEFAKRNALPMFVIGGGSDILVSDKGHGGLVIKYSGNRISFSDEGKDSVSVTAEAGADWDKLVEESVKRNLQGIELMSGIPGTVGASPIQNIGAFGQELKDSFLKLSAYDLKVGRFVVLSKEDCKFSYRDSIFKSGKDKGRYVIVEITLVLNKNKKPHVEYQSLLKHLEDKGLKSPTLSEARDAVIELRGHKLEDPKIIGNAGSFFKNPIVSKEKLNELLKDYPDIPNHPHEGKVKLFSGWLIEKTGWKGKKHKKAAVSVKNALVLTNPGEATSKDIKDLAEQITKDVHKKFGVKLEPEVQFIGFD